MVLLIVFLWRIHMNIFNLPCTWRLPGWQGTSQWIQVDFGNWGPALTETPSQVWKRVASLPHPHPTSAWPRAAAYIFTSFTLIFLADYGFTLLSSLWHKGQALPSGNLPSKCRVLERQRTKQRGVRSPFQVTGRALRARPATPHSPSR